MAKKISILGLRIQNRLQDLNKTQSWLAEKIGISNNAVSKWVSGDSDPAFSKLKVISMHLECSVGYLSGDHSDENISEVVRLMEAAPVENRAKVLLGAIAVLGATANEARAIKKASLSQ